MLALAQLAAAALSLPAHGLPQSQHVFASVPPNPFSSLSHPDLPGQRLRVREPQGLCDPSVHQTSGYLDTDAGHHFYFWSFESRNDPANDPVVLWLNGGPGCSSFTGLLQELGPCRIQPNGHEPVYNPYSWTNNASVIFLDQPVGVGYSYTDRHDKGIWSTEAAARDVYAFLQIYFDFYADKFGNNPFHIAGESFAGRYIPLFADYILNMNHKAESSESLRKINLSSVMIGNGFTDPLRQYASYFPTVCTNKTGYGPYVDAVGCQKMESALPACQSLVKACYEHPSNSALCVSASAFCETRLTEFYFKTGRSSYNMEKFGDYVEEKWIEHWLNTDKVRHELGVDLDPHGHGVKKFQGCSGKVGWHFEATGDGCNWWGNADWSSALEWTNATGFSDEPLRPWFPSPELSHEGDPAKRAGQFRQFGNFAFATVDAAGHFVPYDKPKEALALFQRWTSQRKVGFAAEQR
ncbi:hypothetical protein Rhopal_000403-T1 [Rhodotorula paludigena]|uniref:carboxypeptidase C n=1 Tax=Rhodotorula paludigena TaxID=86838 RepID=A0AAV5GDL7_9BASI|nr:hypothetical protein Rhopal_000403-T1 [Rhodotorula paludigena]